MKSKIVRRNFFREGTLFLDRNRDKEFIYLRAHGLDQALLINEDGEEVISDNPHFFHPEFNPGHISIEYNLL